MSINSWGTLFRVSIIFMTLMLFWYFIIALIYFSATLFINLKLDFFNANILFAIFIISRMFYPKNVFS